MDNDINLGLLLDKLWIEVRSTSLVNMYTKVILHDALIKDLEKMKSFLLPFQSRNLYIDIYLENFLEFLKVFHGRDTCAFYVNIFYARQVAWHNTVNTILDSEPYAVDEEDLRYLITFRT